MYTHPHIRNCINYYRSGLATAEFEVVSPQPEVASFVSEQCTRFWDRGMPGIQEGYLYGWIGVENTYDDTDGPLRWYGLEQFSPRDTFLLTSDRMPVGVRIQNVKQSIRNTSQDSPGGKVDLFMGSKDIPAKGMWYAHMPRYGSFYGQSQLLGAWRPWRRLAWKDAAETVLDTAFYRFGFAGPVVRYPEEDYHVSPTAGAASTTIDSTGLPVRYARDIARQIAEYLKAGAGVGLPSTKYSTDLGGGEKWDIVWPTQAFNGEPILGYIKYLLDQISVGIGVPPELLAATETGSGYSGRAIPMESFLAGQQRIADAILHLFVDQVLRPLVRWNFGPLARFSASVKPLILTKRQMAMGEERGKGRRKGQNSSDGLVDRNRPGTVAPSRHNPGTTVLAGQHADASSSSTAPAAPTASPSLSLAMLTPEKVMAIARQIVRRAA